MLITTLLPLSNFSSEEKAGQTFTEKQEELQEVGSAEKKLKKNVQLLNLKVMEEQLM